MVNVVGFPCLLDDLVAEIRPPQKSKTCQERGSRLNILNDDVFDIAFVKLDKGFFPNGDVCDYSISEQCKSPCGMLLELKGSDSRRAVEQLSKALTELPLSGVKVSYKVAIVASCRGNNIPTTDWTKQVKMFSKKGVKLLRNGSNSSIRFTEAIK